MSAILILLLIIAAMVVYWRVISHKYEDPVTADEIHMVKTADLWTVRLCRYMPKQERGEPVLLCHGLIGNQFSFVYPHGASLIDFLVEQGYDCWAIDLRGSRSSVPPEGRKWHDVAIDDFLEKDIPAALDFIINATGFQKAHWIGHSMGGMLLYAYDLAFGPDKLASGTTLGTPPGFDGVKFQPPALLLKLLRPFPSLFSIFVRALTPFMQLVRPRSRFIPVNWKNLHPAVAPRAFFNMVESAPPAVSEEICSWAARKIWRMRNATLDVMAHLDSLQTPLLVVYGTADPLVNIEKAKTFFDAIRQNDKRLLLLGKEAGCMEDYSHVDLLFSRNGREEVFKPIAEWLMAHPITKCSQDNLQSKNK